MVKKTKKSLESLENFLHSNNSQLINSKIASTIKGGHLTKLPPSTSPGSSLPNDIRTDHELGPG